MFNPISTHAHICILYKFTKFCIQCLVLIFFKNIYCIIQENKSEVFQFVILFRVMVEQLPIKAKTENTFDHMHVIVLIFILLNCNIPNLKKKQCTSRSADQDPYFFPLFLNTCN